MVKLKRNKLKFKEPLENELLKHFIEQMGEVVEESDKRMREASDVRGKQDIMIKTAAAALNVWREFESATVRYVPEEHAEPEKKKKKGKEEKPEEPKS